MSNQKEEIAALKREVAELKAAVQPKPQPSREDQERATAKWIDEMHQMREGRMSMATPPEVVRDWNVLDNATCRDLVQHGTVQSPSMAGTTGAVTGVHRHDGAPVNTSGWREPTPLSNPPGVAQADRLMDAQDRRDRVELAQRIAAHEAAMRAAEKGKD